VAASKKIFRRKINLYKKEMRLTEKNGGLQEADAQEKAN